MGTQEPTKWPFPAAMVTPETWDPLPRSSEEARSTPDAGQVCSAHTPTFRRGPWASLLQPGEIHPGANPPHLNNPSFLSAVK